MDEIELLLLVMPMKTSAKSRWHHDCVDAEFLHIKLTADLSETWPFTNSIEIGDSPAIPQSHFALLLGHFAPLFMPARALLNLSLPAQVAPGARKWPA